MGICLTCGKEFPPPTYGHGNKKKYCSKICGYQAKPKNKLLGIVPRKLMGGYSELCVCADLLKHGYEVYRSVTQHCTGDLMVEKDGKRYKVEVRTSYKNMNGTAQYSKDNIHSDIVALNMTDTNEVMYIEYPSGSKIEM